MSIKDSYVTVGGKKFSVQAYEFLLSRFKEAFSHSSLSVEKAFEELEKFDIELDKSMNSTAYDYYYTLPYVERKKIKETLHQIIVYKGSVYGVISEQLTGDLKQFERLYHDNFEFFEKYIFYYIVFDKDGNFDRVATLHNLETLFRILPQRRKAYRVAYNMKKDNLDAFDYAIKLPKVTIPDVIKINSLVNYSDEDKVDGYKVTNNDILTASFTPTDKRYVPIEMQKLFADYKENFGLTILDPDEDNITNEERLKRRYKLFEREAIFHIRFERIHPFNDGNGRTGRIIMNSNLLRNDQAPVLITEEMSEDYKKYINTFDIEGLTKLLMISSSQQLTNWISLYKAGLYIRKDSIHPENEKLAELEEFSADKKVRVKKRNPNIFGSIIF